MPMALGLVFMIMVNIIDTYWIGQLGTDELAAMTFTFPVVGIVSNIAFGIMIGTSTAVARQLGQGKRAEAKLITTHALYLGVFLVILVSVIGVYAQGAIFRALGASEELIPIVKRYMTIWFLGVVFLIVPLIANGALRADGDAKTPMYVMLIAAITNAVFDPLFIYGWGPVPAMGLEGAAYATLAARVFGMIFAFRVLVFKLKLVDFTPPSLGRLKESWHQILSVGLPATVTNVLGPVAVALITTVVAVHGDEALAAYGIGARVDALILMAPSALCGALSPFVGQNWGAHLGERVSRAVRFALKFVILWGLGSLAVLLVAAEMIASIFTDEPAVLRALSLYLRIIPIGYAGLAVVLVASSTFNAVDRAIRSTWLSLLRTIVIAVPAAWIGSHFLGINGIFIGLVTASVISSLFAIRWLRSITQAKNELAVERVETLNVEEAAGMMISGPVSQAFAGLLDEVKSLEDLVLRKARRNTIGLFVGDRELAHIHKDGSFDIPLPVEIGHNLVRLGAVKYHPGHDDLGWFRANVADDSAKWLTRMAHVLYEISKRGIDDEITQEEIKVLCVSEQCVSALRRSASRWNLKLGKYEPFDKEVSQAT